MEVLEKLLPGKLLIYQKKKGVRFTTDAVLLSGFSDVAADEQVLEIGTGSGVIALLLAYVKGAKVTAVEIQKSYADMAKRSVEINGLEERVKVVEADIRSLALQEASFDVIVSNPPYYRTDTGRNFTQDPERLMAHSEAYLSLPELMQVVDKYLTPRGRICLIYPASRREELLDAMKKKNIQPKNVIMIQSREDVPPNRVFVEGVRGGETKTQERVFLVRRGEEESQEMKEIYRSLGYVEERR